MWLQNHNNQRSEDDFFKLPDSNAIATFVKDMWEFSNSSDKEGIVGVDNFSQDDDVPLSVVKKIH